MIGTLLRRFGTFLLERGGLIGLSCLVAYAALAAPYVVDGDNAEFATLGAIGGAAHPSGYPLYVLLLRATHWLPGSAAHAAALATALIAAAAALVLHAACRAWGARPLAASLAVALYATGPIVLRMSCQAEVFALNNLVVACVLWLAAARGPLRGTWRCAALGLVAGLGLANHMSCALVAPLGVLGVVRGVREARPRALAAAALGLLVGLSPYAYLLVAPDTPASWGAVRTLGELVHHVLRMDYGGPGAFSGTNTHVSKLANLAALANTLGRGWLWAPAVLGLVMLVERTVRGGDSEGRWGWGLLAASWLLAGPLLVMRFDIAPILFGRYVVQRFHLMSLLVLAVPIAIGIDRVASRAALVALPRWLGAAGILAVFAGALGLSLPYLRTIHSPAMQNGVLDMLGAVPEYAVVLAGPDDLYFGTLYAQEVLGVRRDVTVVAWGLMGIPWYRARMRARGVAVPRTGPGVASVRLAMSVLASGRALYCDASDEHVRQALPNYPYAGMFHVLPPGAKAPTIDEVIAENRAVFAKFHLAYPRPGPDDEHATLVRSRYGETWWLLGKALERAGRAADARAAYAIANQIGPHP